MTRHNTESLIRQIEEDARRTASLTGKKEISARVMDAIRRTPRECFVNPADIDLAYQDVPLSIGHGQTISQPFIVALMTDFLDTAPDQRVLEIGTGSGYQAAVLSRLVSTVYSVERIPELCTQAKSNLEHTQRRNIVLSCHDGSQGWPEYAPFDRIIVTAAAMAVPEPLVSQLAPDGKLIMPVGENRCGQTLQLLTRNQRGAVTTHAVLDVIFVPLVVNEVTPI